MLYTIGHSYYSFITGFSHGLFPLVRSFVRSRPFNREYENEVIKVVQRRETSGRFLFHCLPRLIVPYRTDKRGFIATVSPCSWICGGSHLYYRNRAGRSLAAAPRDQIYRVAHARHLDLWLSAKRLPSPLAAPSTRSLPFSTIFLVDVILSPGWTEREKHHEHVFRGWNS